ncbi:helix-turn-helix transcriptional regulator [Microbispora sp. NPDC049125]|uniref:helix-turn-helix transcriptional regulator n=1 Tax=Microbispora sp. NPDC049125 TaxID=3154929 RepID=UPI003466C25A
MRASRLISLVLLLQSRGTMTAADLARELEVSDRTVYRDVLALSAAGIPVYADRGRRGGYRLMDGYRTRLTGLSRAEAEALFLAGLDGPAGQLGLADVAASARLKLIAALPPGLRDAATRTGRRFHLDVPGWFATTDPPPMLAALAGAAWEDRTVRLRYRRREEVVRTVEPYGLVLKAGVWYLVGRVHGDYRTYRVDRVVAADPDGATFTRDEAFDLPAFWAETAAGFVESLLTESVSVRLSPTGLRALRFVAEPPAVRRAGEAAGGSDGDGWVVTRLPVESLEVAFGQMLRLGPEVEVLGPPSLRARMAEAAGRLAGMYGPDRRGDQR